LAVRAVIELWRKTAMEQADATDLGQKRPPTLQVRLGEIVEAYAKNGPGFLTRTDEHALRIAGLRKVGSTIEGLLRAHADSLNTQSDATLREELSCLLSAIRENVPDHSERLGSVPADRLHDEYGEMLWATFFFAQSKENFLAYLDWSSDVDPSAREIIEKVFPDRLPKAKGGQDVARDVSVYLELKAIQEFYEMHFLGCKLRWRRLNELCAPLGVTATRPECIEMSVAMAARQYVARPGKVAPMDTVQRTYERGKKHWMAK
jgi:hypothetical protein